MAVSIYTYYINFGSGYQLTNILNNKLFLGHRRNSKFYGIIDTYLEGSFMLAGADFTAAIAIFDAWGRMPIDVYVNGVQKFTFLANNFIEPDYNQQVLTIKNFDYYNTNSFRFYCTKKFIIPQGSITVKNYEDTANISIYAHSLLTFIASKFTSLGIYETFSASDYWYNSTPEDFTKLRICNNCDLVIGAGILGGSRKETTLQRLFEILECMFNVKVSIDSGAIVFKTIPELASNTLDLSALLTEMNRKKFNDSLVYGSQFLDFSANNRLSSGTDWADVEITYENAADSKAVELTDVSTYYVDSTEMDSNGFYLGYVNATNNLEAELGYKSGTQIQNGHLSPANLLNTNYRNYIFTNGSNFQVCGNAASAVPTNFREFIELPEIPYVLTDITVFYDSIIVEKDGTDERIAIVEDQRTELLTNITTFTVKEFSNSIT